MLISGATVSLAGCVGQNEESTLEETPTTKTTSSTTEKTPTETETTTETEPTLTVETTPVTAESINSVRMNGELVEMVGYDSALGYIERRVDGGDWFPRDRINRMEAVDLSETGDFHQELERFYGATEYEYRAVAETDEEKDQGDVISFSLQDLKVEKPNIEFGNPELTKEGFAIINIPVENVGSLDSGAISIIIQWFDGNDTFLGKSGGRLYTLRAGENGWARATSYADGIDVDAIEDYQVDRKYSVDPPKAPGMEVLESSMDLESSRREITGRATNTLANPPSYVDAIARFYDSEGRVFEDVNWRQTTGDVPKGSNWKFSIRISQEFLKPAKEAESYEVILNQR